MRKSLMGLAIMVMLCGSLTFSSMANAQQTSSGAAIEPGQEPATPAPAATMHTPPFHKFNVFTSGDVTNSGTNLGPCAPVTCESGLCQGCFTFSDSKLTGGLAGATLSGQFVFENNYQLGDCFVTHGIATATAKKFTINFGIEGHSCVQDSVSSDHLQFTGNYVVLGGTGGYGSAAGTGSFTSDFPNIIGETTTRSVVMSGVIQEAK